MFILFARWDISNGFKPSPENVEASNCALLGAPTGLEKTFAGISTWGLYEKRDEKI
jgi:hypothetical protein